MGCCDENFRFSKLDFSLELYDLIQDKDKNTKFELKKISTFNLEKTLCKNISDYIQETHICRKIGKDFKFNINNSLFYFYLNSKYAVVKNFLQVKDLEPLDYEDLYKISIVLTQNYNNLFMPKIYLINKTKNYGDLNNLKIDFSDVMPNKDYIFDPNLSLNKIIFSKPKIIEETIEEMNETDENNNSVDIDLQMNNESDENKSESNSVYEEDQNENDSENEDENENENNKENNNFIYIKDEITPEVVETLLNELSPIIEEQEENDFIVVKKDEKENNIRNSRHFGSSVNSSIELRKNINQNNRRISLRNNNIVINKKGEELKLNLFNIEEEKNIKEKKEKEEKKKFIDSIFIENVKIPDLNIFAEMIGVLAAYNLLKRISFSDFKYKNEKEVWDNIIYLFQENNNIRWVDLHKSYMDDEILNSIAKICENKRFRYLDLYENFIDQEGADSFGEFLSKNKTLQRLNLSHNDLENFKKNGVESICKNLENHPNIQLIDFSSMIVTGCGESVSNLIKTTKSIKNIILKDCVLNFKDIQNICKALSLPNISKTIINVDLSFNDMASDKSIEEIGKMVNINRTLTHLNLEKMNLNKDNYNFILNGLNENDKINHFNFNFNPNIRPKIILEYFLHRKKLSSLIYIPYNDSINEKGSKIEFNLEEKKIIKKFKDKRGRVKLIIN